MRLDQLHKRTLITEGWNDSRLTLLETQHIIPFVSSIENYVTEANLNTQQISQLFTDVEKGATAAGGNRTGLGKGKDAASFINTKMKELGQAVKKSGPVSNIDAKFAELKDKIGAKDSKVVRAIQGVSDWAKDNPGKASIAVAILTVAASMSAGPMGGAIAGFVTRASKDLLQGKDLSTAAAKATKAGVAGAALGAVGDAVSGADTVSDVVGNAAEPLGDNTVNYMGKAYDEDSLRAARDAGEIKRSIAKKLLIKLDLQSKFESHSVNFKPIQVETIIDWCDLTPAVMLTEGPLDAIKKGAAAAGGAIKKGAAAVGAKAAKVGKNMTTKVTADKLNSAWKKAGSPTDSDAVANILRQQGVDDKVLAPVYKTLGAKLPAAPVAPQPKGATPVAPQPKGATPVAPAPMDFKGIQQAVAKLSSQDAKALVTHIDSLSKAPGPKQVNTTPVAPPVADPATQDATAAPTAPKPAPTAPALSSYFQNFSKAMKGASDKNQKITLAKELVNTVADRGGEDSETAVSVLRKFGGDLDNNFKQAAMNALKTGQRLLKQSVYYEINKMLKEHDLSWSDLGMRVHLLEGTNKLIGISLI